MVPNQMPKVFNLMFLNFLMVLTPTKIFEIFDVLNVILWFKTKKSGNEHLKSGFSSYYYEKTN